MKTNTDSAAQTPRELLSELQQLVMEAEKMMGDSLASHTDDAMRALRARFSAAQDRLSAAYDGARERVTAGAKCTDEAIRANPYQSLAIAASVGILVGVLLGRRNS